MGALRAAELAPFGMIGVGAIFEAFRDGVLEADDEVAVRHAPADARLPPTSEALVDIRATLGAAGAAGVVGTEVAADAHRDRQGAATTRTGSTRDCCRPRGIAASTPPPPTPCSAGCRRAA